MPSIFKDHLIHDLAAVDASPPKEVFMRAIEFFESHDPMTAWTVHFEPPFYILKLNPYLIKGSKIINKGTPVFHYEK